jgi:hypothetical protein
MNALLIMIPQSQYRVVSDAPDRVLSVAAPSLSPISNRM